jgi:glycogen operon protein
MTDEAWSAEFVRALGVRLAGDAIDEPDEQGCRVHADTMLLLFNAHHESLSFRLPAHRDDVEWELLGDTHDLERGGRWSGGDEYALDGRTFALFKLAAPSTERRRVEGPRG